MSQTQTYLVQFYEYLNKLGKSVDELPEHLQDLIDKFESAKNLWDKSTPTTKSELFDILLQSDAFISVLIEQEESETPNEIDKVKLMAFKARALKVKWKLNNPKD